MSCEFTMAELSYFLFKKKICPKCNAVMRKEKRCEIVDGRSFFPKSDPVYTRRPNVKHYYYVFCCEKCGSEFPLSALAKKERG